MDTAVSREIIEIPLEEIIPNRFQPRLTFDMEALNDLARSIKEHGIIQPLVVRKIQDKYEIIAGERRFKAASMIGMKRVPCIVMELSDGESAEVAIVENIQRKEMTPLEEAKSFKKLLDKGYLTQEDLGKKMGKSQSSVANKLRLLNLDEVVQDAILNNRISERHARSLLRLNSKEEQREILNEIISKRLTVKQTDDIINNRVGNVQSQQENNGPVINTPIYSNPKISLPEVNIPSYGGNKDSSNPQLKLLNSLGSSTDTKDSYHETIPERKNELPDEKTNPALDIFRFNNTVPIQNDSREEVKEEMNENMIDPSKLQPASSLYNRADEVQPIKPENSFVNLDQVKSSAQDIIKEEKPAPNMDALLYNENPERENMFFVGLEKEEIPAEFEKAELPTEENSTPIEEKVEELPENHAIEEVNDLNEAPKEEVLVENLIEEEKMDVFDIESTKIDYVKAKEELSKTIGQLKEKGLKVYKEEADFGSTVQIIIRIDK